MQIITEKVVKIEVYNPKGRFLTVTSLFKYPKELIKKGKGILVSFTGQNLENLRCGDNIRLVFVYADSSRHETTTTIEKKEDIEFTVRIGEVTQLEERRRSFKIVINKKIDVYLSKKADAKCHKGKVVNINLGGVLLKFEEDLPVGSEIWLNFPEVNLEFRTQVLRKQLDANGKFIGYGCQFLDVTNSKEEALSQYIMQCQIEERRRLKSMEE